jgi:hypothetical protein
VELPDGIGPALPYQFPVGLTDLDAKQRVVQPAFRLVDIQLRWHDVVVAREDDRHL